VVANPGDYILELKIISYGKNNLLIIFFFFFLKYFIFLKVINIYIYIIVILLKGQFNAFKTNSISMNVKIKECNLTERISQDRDGININSW